MFKVSIKEWDEMVNYVEALKACGHTDDAAWQIAIQEFQVKED